MKWIPYSFFTLAVLIITTSGARILMLPLASSSHVVYFGQFGIGLRNQGHAVTIVIPTNTEVPGFMVDGGIKVYQYQGEEEQFVSSKEHNELMVKMALASNFLDMLKIVLTTTEELDPNAHWMNDCDGLFQDHELLENIRNSKFDFAIVDGIYPPCFYTLAYKFGIPYGSLSIPVCPASFRVPHLGSQVPNVFILSDDKMSFFTRVLSFMVDMLEYIMLTATLKGDFVRKYVQEKPYLSNLELHQRGKLNFQIYDPVLSFPRPKMPNVVFVGDIMARPVKQLPKALTHLVNSAKHGVILVSLGTMMESLPENLTTILYDALGKVKETVIMKKAGKIPETLSNNINLMDWIPQNDLLGNPNVKLFITHCGLNSVVEAVYHGVPVVGLPLAYDQPFNALALNSKGFGKTLKWGKLTVESLKASIEEVINNKTYREAAKHMSMIFRDKTEGAAERASFSINHMIQHGDSHLRTEAFNLNIFQFLMWDIFLFIFVVIIVSITISIYCIKVCCRCICKQCLSKRNKTKKE